MIRKLRQWITDTFGVSKTEANGTLVLMSIVLILIFFQQIHFTERSSMSMSVADKELLEKWSDELERAFSRRDSVKTEPPAQAKTTRKLFKFDPNKATRSQLQVLGFSDRVATNIIRYRESGGHFATRADLKKIYGMDSMLLKRLHVFIELPESDPMKSLTKKATPKPLRMELNTATLLDYQQVKGIGPVLSERIVRFRDKLGGFHSTSQLYEVYGLDSAVASRLAQSAVITTEPKRLNLNADSAKLLYAHPYIDYKIANIIINYRQQHGNFDSVSEIRAIKIISDSLYQKIYPYLSIYP